MYKEESHNAVVKDNHHMPCVMLIKKGALAIVYSR